MRAWRATGFLAVTLALGLPAGGTPERDIFVSVRLEGGPPPSDTLLVSTLDVIPTSVTPGQVGVPVYGLSLTRTSQSCAAPLYLIGVGFRITSLEGAPMDPSQVIERIEPVLLTRGATETRGSAAPRRRFDDKGEGEALLEVRLVEPALVPAAGRLEIEIVADIDPRTTAPGFNISLDEGHIVTGHEGCSSPVAQARSGELPGVVISTTTIIPATLAGSFSNYPNPFAAGRENTTFAFYLRGRANVTLRLYDGFGRLISTLDAGTSRAGGLVHEDITWNGKDHGGAKVQNGTYFAVLSARYESGGSEEAVRKVAVLR